MHWELLQRVSSLCRNTMIINIQSNHTSAWKLTNQERARSSWTIQHLEIIYILFIYWRHDNNLCVCESVCVMSLLSVCSPVKLLHMTEIWSRFSLSLCCLLLVHLKTSPAVTECSCMRSQSQPASDVWFPLNSSFKQSSSAPNISSQF